MTGSNMERELINDVLIPAGWEPLRAPSSGSATERELPDVLAGRPAEAGERQELPGYAYVLAIEAKYRSDSPAYFGREELEDLMEFASKFGAKPLVAARWNAGSGSFAQGDTTWYFAPPSGVAVTTTKAKLEYEECVKHWQTIDQLVERVERTENE